MKYLFLLIMGIILIIVCIGFIIISFLIQGQGIVRIIGNVIESLMGIFLGYVAIDSFIFLNENK